MIKQYNRGTANFSKSVCEKKMNFWSLQDKIHNSWKQCSKFQLKKL